MRYLFALVIIIIIAVSCTKMEESGPLPGMWQLMTVERNGEVKNVKDNKVYWSERGGLLQLTSPNASINNIMAHVNIIGDSLIVNDICFPSDYSNETDDNVFISYEKRETVFPWGLYAVKENDRLRSSYFIRQLDESKMVLVSDSSCLAFRKF